jgi:hypothetical protein
MWRPILYPLFLIAAGAILVSTTVQYGAGREPRTILGLPNGFQGTLAVPKQEVAALFAKAKYKISTLNQAGNRWRWAAFGFDWMAFLLAAVIGAIAAFYGRLQEEGRTLQEQLDFIRRRNRRHATLIGVFAAVMAVSSSIGNRCGSVATASYQRADEVASAARNTRTTLDANMLSEAQARATVDDFEKELQR